MNKRPVFFFPALNPNHAPEFLPDDVLFMSAGLDEHAGTAFKEKLPFSAQQARMILDEMLNLGFNLGPQAAFGKKTPFLGPNIKDRELKAIRDFAEKGTVSPESGGQSAKELEQARQDCQKALLLAWELEKRREELSEIENTYLEKARLLRDALGEAGGGEDPDYDLAELDHHGEHSLPGDSDGFDSPQEAPDWRIVAGAGLAFLPEDALLLTDSKEVFDELSELEALGAVPDPVAESIGHWPENFLQGLSYACLPGWKLAGRGKWPDKALGKGSGKGPGAWPWLKRDIGILVFSMKTNGAPDV